MEEAHKEHIRGVLLLLPIIIAIVVVVMVAQPVSYYDSIASSEVTTSTETTDTTTLRPFNPNVDDYRTLVGAGVPRDIAVGIIRWREAGKVYHIREDIALCNGMTDSLYYLLEPYIIIGKEHEFQHAEWSDKPKERHRATIALQPFTLDTVGTDYLRALGFTRREAELVVNYRDMIGGYRNIEEFEECYAVDSTMAERLRPYIIFPEHNDIKSYASERIVFPIELNSADSATLCKVSGIGAKSASHILYYRELLGGYHSVSQILELKVVTEENFQRILTQIYCDSAKIKKININFARPKEMEVHPYISNHMLEGIISNRELKGGWSNLEEIIEDNIFSKEEAARIAPYLDFSIPEELDAFEGTTTE